SSATPGRGEEVAPSPMVGDKRSAGGGLAGGWGVGRYVGVTMLGNTTRGVMEVKDLLAARGYEAVIFHSNGVGGPAMEELIEQGLFAGVIDYTTDELADPLLGGYH